MDESVNKKSDQDLSPHAALGQEIINLLERFDFGAAALREIRDAAARRLEAIQLGRSNELQNRSDDVQDLRTQPIGVAYDALREMLDSLPDLSRQRDRFQELLLVLAGRRYPSFSDNNRLARHVNAARKALTVRVRVIGAKDSRAVTITCVRPASQPGGYFQAIPTTPPRTPPVYSGDVFPDLEVIAKADSRGS